MQREGGILVVTEGFSNAPDEFGWSMGFLAHPLVIRSCFILHVWSLCSVFLSILAKYFMRCTSAKCSGGRNDAATATLLLRLRGYGYGSR